MARYHVFLDPKSTAAEPQGQWIEVIYEASNYTEAWVGARTVCRLGTLFKDDPKCKIATNAREFFREDPDSGESSKLPIGPAAFTVRKIMVEGTRKTGKQRMTTLSFDDLKKVMDDNKIKLSKKLEETLGSLLQQAEGGGLRVTTATARRLGLMEDEGANDE